MRVVRENICPKGCLYAERLTESRAHPNVNKSAKAAVWMQTTCNGRIFKATFAGEKFKKKKKTEIDSLLNFNRFILKRRDERGEVNDERIKRTWC